MEQNRRRRSVPHRNYSAPTDPDTISLSPADSPRNQWESLQPSTGRDKAGPSEGTPVLGVMSR